MCGLWAADVFQEEADTAKEMQANGPQAICRLGRGTGTTHGCRKGGQIQGKRHLPASGAQSGGQNKPTAWLTGVLQASC